MSDQNVVCVLGMHRSGTSCLAGSLQAAGLFSGNIFEKGSIHNPKGLRENKDIMKLNNEILAFNHSSWHNPPTNITWSQYHREQRDKIINDFFDNGSIWMFKEPRTVLTVPFWTEKINNLIFIGTFRNPLKVAISLYQRNRNLISIRKGINLWIHYNQIILDLYNQEPFPLICFDLPGSKYLIQLEELIKNLNTKISENNRLSISEAKTFYETDLVTHDADIIPFIDTNLDNKSDQELFNRAEKIYHTLIQNSGLTLNDFPREESSLFIPISEKNEILEKIIQLQPNNHHAYYILGNIQYKQKQTSKTILNYQKALELKPKSKFIYPWLVSAYVQHGNFLNDNNRSDEAIEICSQALKLDPNNANVYYCLGNAKYQQDHFEEAIANYNKTIEKKLANFNYQIDQIDKAVKNNSIDLYNRNFRSIFFKMAQSFEKQNDLHQAIMYYQYTLKLEGNKSRIIKEILKKLYVYIKLLKLYIKMALR